MTVEDDLLRTARQEEERLVKELRAFPLFRKLESVRAVINTYSGNENEADHDPHRSESSAPQGKRQPRSGSLSVVVVKAAYEFLSSIRRRADSNEILEAVQKRGIVVKGVKPAAVVSSYLSQSDLFDNVRPGGYGLKEWTSAHESAGNSASS